MSQPTNASRSIEIAVPRQAVYDLVADITRTGEWSPECRSCEWVDGTGAVGARFRGRNRQGVLRWTTTAEVITADAPNEFAFATLNGDQHSTRWSYSLSGETTTTLTESFEAVSTPWLIELAERLFLRHRQEQLEAGLDTTLARIKAIAER